MPRHDAGLEGDAPTAVGGYSYRVDMWYQGTFIGSALIESTHSSRSARVMALRGIACSVYPMNDSDRAVFTREMHRRRLPP